MNAYTKVEEFNKDLLKYVDYMLASYYEATEQHSREYVLGWQLKTYTDAALKYEAEAAAQLEMIEQRLELTHSTSVFIPLAHALETFMLNKFEKFCIYLCLAVELDPSFEKNMRYFNEKTLGNPVIMGRTRFWRLKRA